MIDDPRFVAPKDPVKPDKGLVVRDSILPECLYSLLVAVTIMSCLMIIKTYVVTINISMYSQYVVLILALGHALIRRSGIKNKYINLAVQLASSAVFYIAVINIKIFGFGADRRTKFYLAAFVIAPFDSSILSKSPVGCVSVPLKNKCSRKCDTPVFESSSFIEPVFIHVSIVTIGLFFICSIITVCPLFNLYKE